MGVEEKERMERDRVKESERESSVVQPESHTVTKEGEVGRWGGMRG